MYAENFNAEDLHLTKGIRISEHCEAVRTLSTLTTPTEKWGSSSPRAGPSSGRTWGRAGSGPCSHAILSRVSRQAFGQM